MIFVIFEVTLNFLLTDNWGVGLSYKLQSVNVTFYIVFENVIL